MNNYFILFLLSGITIYAQNPSEKSAFDLNAVKEKNGFDLNLARADVLYSKLTEDEQRYCDLIYAGISIEHAQDLIRKGKKDLVPVQVDPEQDVDALNAAKRELAEKLQLSDNNKTLHRVINIALIRTAAYWRDRAYLTGRRKTTWPFTYGLDDPNHFSQADLEIVGRGLFMNEEN